jgi:hypothetical protein
VTVSVLPAACSSGSAQRPPAINRGPFAGQAEQVITDLAAGQYQAVWGMFEPTLKVQLPVTGIESGWRAYQQRFGSYRGHGLPELIQVGSLDVEQMPMFMSRGTEEARVTFDPGGSIAGLGLLKAGAPPPSAL